MRHQLNKKADVAVRMLSAGKWKTVRCIEIDAIISMRPLHVKTFTKNVMLLRSLNTVVLLRISKQGFRKDPLSYLDAPLRCLR